MIKIRNKRKGILNLRFGVSLHSGDNDVDPAAWEHCRKDPITLHYLQAGDVEVIVTNSQMPTAKAPTVSQPVTVGVEAKPAVVETKAAPEPDPPLPEDEDTQELEQPKSEDDGPSELNPDEATKMRAKDVITLVGCTDEIGTLKNMLMTETRPTVRAAIEHRLGELKD